MIHRGASLLKIIDNILLVRRDGELNGKFFNSKQFFAVASLQIYTHFRKKSYFWVGQEMGGDSVGFTSHQKHSSTVQVYAICYILRGSFFFSDSEKLQSSGENSDCLQILRSDFSGKAIFSSFFFFIKKFNSFTLLSVNMLNPGHFEIWIRYSMV